MTKARSRFGAMLAAISVLAVAFAVTPGHATGSSWLAGAAAEKVTPPAFNAAKDLVEFPEALCPRAVFNGKRIFDIQEPYTDTDNDGTFDYTQDLYCDANANGRWDGMYSSGGVDHILEWVHDDIWARAVAISDGTNTVVIESITSQGLLIEDDLRIRNQVKADRGVAQVYVSSSHNESSPDPIGIYGAPDDGTGAAGVHSGVNDYYINFLVQQAVKAADEAVDAMVAAKMRITEFSPADVRARLSNTFLTTDAIKNGVPAFGTPEATDTKGRVLQLVRASDDANIETIFNWAAHNQQIGHASDSVVAPGGLRVNRAVSDDWPGYFASAVESQIGGHAMFMVGDNGSIEDPQLVPPGSPVCPGGRADGCFELAAQTGPALANDVVAALGSSEEIAHHSLTPRIDQFYVPLQNQLFMVAFANGLFAHRTAATILPCLDNNHVPQVCFLTEVGLVDFGPQLQMLVNPGEAYPALMEGHPFGIEQMSCPGRAEPPVPAWHSTAEHKLQMGLGDDLIGYEVPGPGWFADVAVENDPTCPMGAQFQDDPTADYDQNDQYHKLESESVGPDGGNLVAQHLSALADLSAATPNDIRSGRFLTGAGSFTRKGADGPVGMWVLPNGTSTFAPGVGMLIAIAGVNAFGSTPVTAHGVFMDFDGRAQSSADINTRGMLFTNPDNSVTRYYMDPYAVLTGSSPGAAS